VSLTMSRPDTKRSTFSGQVISQLALFEGRRQLRSPFLWLAFLASLILVWLAVHDDPGTLWARSVTIAGSCLPIAVVALLLGNTAALRDHSSRVGETVDVPPTNRDLRMLGLIAGAWAALLLAVAAVIFGVVLSVADDPAGSFRVPELIVGPVLVPLGQALGVALGRWLPNPLVAPLTLVILAGLFLVQDFWPGERTIPAASPFLPWRKGYTLDWVQAEPRMPLLHLAYLIGLIGVFGASAARRWSALAVASLVVAGTAVGLAGIETAGEQVGGAVDRWAEEQPRVCEERNGVRYCAFDGYQAWIDDWAGVVARVQSLVPEELQVETVEQTTSGLAARGDTDPRVVHVRGRLPVDDDLTKQILATELGMPGTDAEAALMNSHLPACMAAVLPVLVSGEARAVAYLVLNELAVPGTIATDGFGTYRLGHIELSEDEAELALEIVRRPEVEILAVLHASWEQLTNPATTTAALAEWFGLQPPLLLEASSYESMECECVGGGVSCTGREP
jgi:hypothetical protein